MCLSKDHILFSPAPLERKIYRILDFSLYSFTVVERYTYINIRLVGESATIIERKYALLAECT